MFKLVEWTPELDCTLTSFYAEAGRRGFVNNASRRAMVDCFRNEREKQIWILYENDRAVGSVAAHSFNDVMGPGSYRILARTCSFAETRPTKGLLTINRMMAEHQHISDQFFLPKCIEWAGRENLYATSNASTVASQRLVHSIYFPTLEKLGLVERVKDIHYRHTDQTVWKFNVNEFEKSLNKFPRWELS